MIHGRKSDPVGVTVGPIPHRPARSRWLSMVLIAIAFVGRPDVGARRLPLALVGIAALGVAAGYVATLVVGVLDAGTAALGRAERAAS